MEEGLYAASDPELTAAERYQLDNDYNAALAKFDSATCEAVAVSQAIGVQMAEAHVGHSTYIFARLCNHAISMISAVPRSRWIRSDFEQWDFGGAAGHSRAILEGFLLFLYVVETPSSKEEWSAKINVMYLNDCVRRIKMIGHLATEKDIEDMEAQAEELRGRLNANAWFAELAPSLKKRCLSGDNLMIPNRDEMLERAGWEKKHFYAMWDLLSQYAHVLPISFFRMVPSGRGTGIENDTDKSYTSMMLDWCADTLVSATDLMMAAFPTTQAVRQGIKSKFDPGPRSNRRVPSRKKRKKVR